MTHIRSTPTENPSPPSALCPAVPRDGRGAGASCLAEVPSVVVPEESNLLLNPRHPDAARITARKLRRWLYDPRTQRASYSA